MTGRLQHRMCRRGSRTARKARYIPRADSYDEVLGKPDIRHRNV